MRLEGVYGLLALCIGLMALGVCAWRGVPGSAVALAGAATSIVAYVTRPMERAAHDDGARKGTDGP